MHRMTRRPTWAVIVCALAAWWAVPALGQETPAVKIAVVSLQRVQSDYQALHTQEEDLGQWLQERTAPYKRLADFVFLSEKDFQEALELLRTGDRSEAEQTRLDELRRISEERDKRHSDLQSKPDRTADETAEFNTLQEMLQARTETLRELEQEIAQELGDRRQTAISGLMTTVEDAIRAEAEAGGYTLVLDADAVFFGGDDITDAVIARLNAGEEAGGGEAEAGGGEAEDGGGEAEDGGGEAEDGGEGGAQDGGEGGG